MQLKIVDSRPWKDENEKLIGTIYTVFCEDEDGTNFVEVNVNNDDDSLVDQLGKTYAVNGGTKNNPNFVEVEGDSVQRFEVRQSTPPEAYAAFVRLYLEWMEMTEDEQIEYTHKNVRYAGLNHKKYISSTGRPFKKSGDKMYGEEFDGYVSEAWATLGERFTDVDGFAIYLQKNFRKYSRFPMSGDILRRAAQNMMGKERRYQIKSSKGVSIDSSINATGFTQVIPDTTIDIESIITLNDFLNQIRAHIKNPVRLQIFDLLMNGYKQREIADMIKITPAATSKHVKKIREIVDGIRFD